MPLSSVLVLDARANSSQRSIWYQPISCSRSMSSAAQGSNLPTSSKCLLAVAMWSHCRSLPVQPQVLASSPLSCWTSLACGWDHWLFCRHFVPCTRSCRRYALIMASYGVVVRSWSKSTPYSWLLGSLSHSWRFGKREVDSCNHHDLVEWCGSGSSFPR